jgi:hypothetical protein
MDITLALPFSKAFQASCEEINGYSPGSVSNLSNALNWASINSG